MRNLILTFCLMIAFNVQSQTGMVSLLNFPVGGTWVSENVQNDGEANSFSTFFMKFKTWSSESSVVGNIYGVRNNEDTVQLLEVWNFLDKVNKNAFLVQRTTWGEKSIGTVAIYEEKHLDIQFKSTTSSGEEYYTRDIHYIISDNEMKAVTYQKRNESDEWAFASESIWKRIKS